MNYLWSPWRFKYVSTAAKQSGCIFCDALMEQDPNVSLIVYRGNLNFVILNRYPYNNGHLMIAPYQHTSNPAEVPLDVLNEMMELSQRALKALKEIYHPDGFNLGMNLGRSAGAGVEEHYHLHVLPRWGGDTSFISAIADTRVIPEDFPATLRKLKPYFLND